MFTLVEEQNGLDLGAPSKEEMQRTIQGQDVEMVDMQPPTEHTGHRYGKCI
jgi:hypothetical protein